jgi:hypothetical protein
MPNKAGPTTVLIDTAQQAPAPSKDYVHLKLTQELLTFTRIIINPRCMQFPVAPQTIRLTLEEYNENVYGIQEKIEYYFPNYLEKVQLICDGHTDALTILPLDILINICKNLAPEDIIGELAKVSKPLRDLCKADDLWKALYDCNITDTEKMSQEMKDLAMDIGWEKFYFSRVINTRRGTKKSSSRAQLKQQQAV